LDGELIDIALDLGFSSHSHFTDIFRRTFGNTPSAVRQALQIRSSRH
jgi:AraC-like DNA-binding protein